MSLSDCPPSFKLVKLGNPDAERDALNAGIQAMLRCMGESPLPDPTGHAGEYLTTDGTTFSWAAAGGGSGQSAIQFEDEGVPLGATGTVDTLDFAGSGVTASRVGDVVTVTIPGGGGGTITRQITGVFSNNGLPLSGTITGTAVWIPYDFTITGWHMGGDGNVGSGTVDVQTSTNQTSWASITAAATPVTASARSAASTTLTGWTTNITGGIWVRFVGSNWGGWNTSSTILTVTTP